MRSVFLAKTIFLAAILGVSLTVAGQNRSPADTFPVPPESPNRLFYLQRQPNSNTVIYDLNIKNNQIVTNEPVHAYWIRYQEKGQKQELNWIQRTFAYGIHAKRISDKEYELNFVSYKKRKFWLVEDPDGHWRVYTDLDNGKKMSLKKIYIHIEGGSLWQPNIEYVELQGLKPGTDQVIKERIKIK